MYGDYPEAVSNSFDTEDWYDVGIPHSFGIPYFMEHEFYVGYGCYRKLLNIREEWAEKKIGLEFLGVFQIAEIYVNGKFVKKHKGGYSAFFVDISDYVQVGENTVFVRVNNIWDPKLAPRGGEHVFNGGIYRDVSLVVTDPIHIAWYGTFVTTPEVNHEEALIHIKTELCNEAEAIFEGQLISLIGDPKQEAPEYSMLQNVCLKPGETIVVEQNCRVKNPRLWHPDHPEMYLLTSKLISAEDEIVMDEGTTDFGIRWFSFTADKGFFLNGEHYDIHGANVHQDHAGWSDAVTHTGIRRDIKMVKECGMNFIRGSHYPHHPYFAEECDRQGILFWSENCYWGVGGPKEEGYWLASAYPINEDDEEEFEASCMESLEAMIRINRNHPSIIVWSMCNEPFFSEGEVMDKARALLGKLVERSHELDPTRPAAAGGVQRGGFDKYGDLAGYNGDGAAIFINPGIPNFVSEYGSMYEDRPGKFVSRYLDGVENNPEWRSGKSLWCAFHHGSIIADMGHMGIIDYYRLPLNGWYWYRENLKGVPSPEKCSGKKAAEISLFADRTEMKGDGTEDAQIYVCLMDEKGKQSGISTDVVLEVTRGGGVFPTGKKFELSERNHNFAEGLGAVELHCWYSGDTVIRAYAPGTDLEPRELMIHVTGGLDNGLETRNLLQPSPCKMGAPEKKRRYEIALNRPVFCSSALEEFPARNVTDGSYQTCWRAASQESGEWIMVDLEGTKKVERLCIDFADVVKGNIQIQLSDDRKQFRNIYVSDKSDVSTGLEFSFIDTQTRYIRLLYLDKPAGVCKIEVWV